MVAMLNLIGFMFSLFVLLVFGNIYYMAFGPVGVVVAVIAFIFVLPLHLRWLDKRRRQAAR